MVDSDTPRREQLVSDPTNTITYDHPTPLDTMPPKGKKGQSNDKKGAEDDRDEPLQAVVSNAPLRPDFEKKC